MDFESAAEALAGANDDAPEAVVPAVSEQAPVDAPVDAGTTPEVEETTEDSFTNIDLDSLAPEVRAAVEDLRKNLQADYTRKTQEIAEFRNLGMSAEEARNAVATMERLKDPATQRELYDALHSQFGTPEVDAFGEPEDFEDGTSPDPRDQQIQDLASRLERFEQSQVQAQVTAELDRMEAVLRSDNPDWDDTDIREVEKFALAHRGDLLKGAEDYKALQQRVLSAHLQRKASVPAAGHIPATGNAEIPAEPPKTTEEAMKIGLAMLAAEQAN